MLSLLHGVLVESQSTGAGSLPRGAAATSADPRALSP